MSSIGRTKHLRCQHEGCNKVRPYWSDLCKAHRIARAQVASATQQSKQTKGIN